MLYLVDEPMAEIALRTVAGDADPRVVLVQDGVLLASRVASEVDTVTYAIAKDVEVRGVDVPSDIEVISYDTLIELVVEHETKSFV